MSLPLPGCYWVFNGSAAGSCPSWELILLQGSLTPYQRPARDLYPKLQGMMSGPDGDNPTEMFSGSLEEVSV